MSADIVADIETELAATADAGIDLGAEYLHGFTAALAQVRERLRAEATTVRSIAERLAHQPNDYDEDTEAEIAAGNEILAALTGRAEATTGAVIGYNTLDANRRMSPFLEQTAEIARLVCNYGERPVVVSELPQAATDD